MVQGHGGYILPLLSCNLLRLAAHGLITAEIGWETQNKLKCQDIMGLQVAHTQTILCYIIPVLYFS